LEGVQKTTEDLIRIGGVPAAIQNRNISNYAIHFKGNCPSTCFRTLAKEKRGFICEIKSNIFFLILHFLLPGLKSNVKGITYYRDTCINSVEALQEICQKYLNPNIRAVAKRRPV